MKRLLTLLLLCSTVVGSAMAWDNRGHSTVAYIAERHLTPRAKANIEQYINGQSIVYYSAWMDHNRTTPPYNVTHDWHVDYWTDDQRVDAEGNPQPPISVSNVKRIISEMGDFRTLPDSVVNVNIKYLVHLLGDIHCPVHVNFAKTRPIRTKFGGKTVKYHAMWDGHVAAIKHKGLSPMTIAETLDIHSPEQIAAFQAGTPDDWHLETTQISDEVYAMLPEENKLSNVNYFNKAVKIANLQWVRAGYRLAHVLNTIFDK